MKAGRYIVLVIFSLVTLSAHSQQREYEFKNITQEDGLPSNESYFVYRDSKDFLWFATDQGVVRYNGSKMEHFNLPDNVVFKIREDSKGRIWFFSRTVKLAHFFNGSIYPYKYNDSIAKYIDNTLISDAYVNSTDEIFINSGTQRNWENYNISGSGRINKTGYLGDRNSVTTFRITKLKNKEFFTQRQILNPAKTDSIRIELVTESHTLLYNIPCAMLVGSQFGCVTEDERDFFFFNDNVVIKLRSDGSFKIKKISAVVTCLHIDKNIWIGLIKNGAVMMDKDLNAVIKEPVLNGKSVTSINTDHEGGIWFSTLEKGIFYLKNSGIHHFSGDSSIKEPVFRIYNSGDSNILYAGTSGIYKTKNNLISSVSHDKYTYITDLFADENSNIFISGTYPKNYCVLGCTGKKSSDPYFNNIFFMLSFSEIIKRNKNGCLICAYGHTAEYTIDPKAISAGKQNCITPDSINKFIIKPGVLFKDFNGQVWIGTINALYKLRSMNAKAEEFKPDDSLLKKGITAIRQLENGIYSFGIRFGGIALMKDTSIIARITEKEGLLSNSIKYILPLKDQLWLATAKGISVIHFKTYSPVTYTITNIGKNEGLYNMLIYQLVPYQGNMLAATSNGIYEINNPEQYLEKQPEAIPFYINSINYYKGDTSQVNTITLPYNKNRIAIRYSAVIFNLPDEIKYYYKLDNEDKDWQEITSTEFLMENLIPGTYNLQLRAAIPSEHRFSKIQKLKIIVEGPWWQNNWLKLLLLSGILATLYFLYKNKVKKVTAQEQQKMAVNTKMMELEQTALRAQMNPHFIFNCLTSIQQLIASGNKDEADKYLVKFARLIRKTLELSGNNFISVEEEVAYLKEYIVMEQLRIPGQFEFSINIDPAIDIMRTDIPNMMLQPIIENSIRHGIKHLTERKGKISVTMHLNGPYILCSVADNGTGRALKPAGGEHSFRESKSYGISIVNKRLEILSARHNLKNTFEVEDLLNNDGTAAGTKVIIKLPYKTT